MHKAKERKFRREWKRTVKKIEFHTKISVLV